MLKAPQIVMQMLRGTLDKNPAIHTYQCRSLHVRRTQPGVIHYDGEPAEAGTDIDIRLVPGGLRVVVNELQSRPKEPVEHIFQDLYDQITGDIKSQQRKLLAINKELLNRLLQRS